MLKLGCCFLQP